MFRAVPLLLSDVLAVVSACMVALGGELFLEDTDDHLFGPLPDAEGREIEIGGRAYRLVGDSNPDFQLERQLRRILIPRLEFIDASLWDALRRYGTHCVAMGRIGILPLHRR